MAGFEVIPEGRERWWSRPKADCSQDSGGLTLVPSGSAPHVSAGIKQQHLRLVCCSRE
jgi:hypothetical protein